MVVIVLDVDRYESSSFRIESESTHETCFKCVSEVNFTFRILSSHQLTFDFHGNLILQLIFTRQLTRTYSESYTSLQIHHRILFLRTRALDLNNTKVLFSFFSLVLATCRNARVLSPLTRLISIHRSYGFNIARKFNKNNESNLNVKLKWKKKLNKRKTSGNQLIRSVNCG